MPTYEYACEKCGAITEFICRIADRPETIPCFRGNNTGPDDYACSGKMRQVIITAPMIQCDDLVNCEWIRDFAHHHNRKGGKRDRFGGKPIESRQDYKDYLKAHDLRETESESTVHFPEDAEHDRIAKEMGMKP